MMVEKEEMISNVKEFVKKMIASQIKTSFFSVVKDKIQEIKRNILKSIAYVVFMIIGVSLLLIGIVEYLKTIFPVLNHGVGYLILGILFMIIAIIIKITK